MTSEKRAVQIVKTLRRGGHQAYFCGGYVRDMILKRKSKDIDIVTSATPTEVNLIFKNSFTTGERFLVSRVEMDGEIFEVATYRSEGEYSDGRRPNSVKPASIIEDCARRDFTINALYYDPVENRIIDHVGGTKDAESKTLRFVGNPKERIKEDYLRVLRGVRMASFLDNVDEKTALAIKSQVEVLKGLPSEPIREEFNKGLLQGPSFRAKYFQLLKDYGVLGVVVPELADLHGSEQSPKHHPEGDVFSHTKLMLQNAGENPSIELIWGILMHDIAKPHTFEVSPETGLITNHGHAEVGEPISRKIMGGLRFSGEEVSCVSFLVRKHMTFKDFPKMKRSKKITLLKNKWGELLLELHRIDCISSNGNLDNYEAAKQFLAELPEDLPPELLNGEDLIKLGFPKGPELGKIKKDLREQQFEGNIVTKAKAIKYVNSNFSDLKTDSSKN